MKTFEVNALFLVTNNFKVKAENEKQAIKIVKNGTPFFDDKVEHTGENYEELYSIDEGNVKEIK